MKYLVWGLGGLVALAVLVLGVERLAAERVEVVELHTLDAQGEEISTRLWVVDDAGLAYLRVGAGGSGWFERLSASETVSLTRGGETRRYRPLLRPDKSDRINALLQEKYTWGDDFIAALVGSREGALPIELQPL